ncbi:STE-domain-containing protein [Lichtheimia hyalospora FSU 10163]|nr:STE-domain-containing protein [Lichtheimia hyalospora FSU 10163]
MTTLDLPAATSTSSNNRDCGRVATATASSHSSEPSNNNNNNNGALMCLPRPTNNDTDIRLGQIDELKYFLATATNDWDPEQAVKSFALPTTGESVSCVFWNNLFHITGTDIVRCLVFRFHAFGRPVCNLKKFEEGVFSDLRNLKPGSDACLEDPKSEFLDMLYKNNCIRTQKKQKVFYWFSVPHDRLFLDALERDLKREKMGIEPTSQAVADPATLLSLDTTHELFDQLRKSMALSAAATAHALEDDQQEKSTNGFNLQVTVHDEDLSSDIGRLDLEPPPPQPCRLRNPKAIFGMVSLFEGSASYKQRRRRAASLSSTTTSTALVTSNHATETARRHRSTSNPDPDIPLSSAIDDIAFSGCPSASSSPLSSSMSTPSNSNVSTPRNTIMLSTSSYNALASATNALASLGDDAASERTYTCPLGSCGRYFRRLEHLKRHLRTHTMERPYLCHQCGKRFSRSDNLAQHRKTHDRATNRHNSKKGNGGGSGNGTSSSPPPPTSNGYDNHAVYGNGNGNNSNNGPFCNISGTSAHSHSLSTTCHQPPYNNISSAALLGNTSNDWYSTCNNNDMTTMALDLEDQALILSNDNDSALKHEYWDQPGIVASDPWQTCRMFEEPSFSNQDTTPITSPWIVPMMPSASIPASPIMNHHVYNHYNPTTSYAVDGNDQQDHLQWLADDDGNATFFC